MRQPSVATITTNVPGPQVQLYMLGRPLRTLLPYVPLGMNQLITVAIMSYNGGITCGVTADYDKAPDCHVLAQGIERSLEGLVALTQNPESQPGGEVRWKRERVMGTPITIVDNAAAFWCAKCRKVTLVALKDGSILREVSLPAVDNLEADTIEEGGFLAWSADGRIERLSPRTKPAAATANAAK